MCIVSLKNLVHVSDNTYIFCSQRIWNFSSNIEKKIDNKIQVSKSTSKQYVHLNVGPQNEMSSKVVGPYFRSWVINQND